MRVDTLILGAGAAGMMCAAHCRGRTLVIDHAKAPGEKIRISGGGRCNFTNMYCGPPNFLGKNPHFHKSALSRYTQWDFIDLVASHGIAYHEKTLGQLFCDGSSRQIVAMLRNRLEAAGADLWLLTSLVDLSHRDSRFAVTLEREGRQQTVDAGAIVVATGGKSIPKMGATGLGYDIARQFGMAVTDTRAGLVPLTFGDKFKPLSGVSLPARVTAGGAGFDEALLFTHRGLSGPAVLQASSFWQEGGEICVNLDPGDALVGALKAGRQTHGKKAVSTVLGGHLPARLVDHLASEFGLSGRLGDLSDKRIDEIAGMAQNWRLRPSGSEGYRTAEVTLGGVDTDGLSSKTMMSNSVRGLYFIGECVDVTGWLGGYNFQWAWSSAVAAAEAITASQTGA